jgi:hypothetical protein
MLNTNKKFSDPPTTFPLLIRRTTKGSYFRHLTNFKFTEVNLVNFPEKETPTTEPKVANIFTKMKP